MTKEEIKNLRELIDLMLDKCILADSRTKVFKRLEEVCDLAIKALEQEQTYYPPCIDCNKKMDEIRCAYDKLKEQEPKTGHWISEMIQLICSECGYKVYPWNNTNYCPNCGAKMIEPQESEEKC